MSSGSVSTKLKILRMLSLQEKNHIVLKIMCREHADKLWLFQTSPLTRACVVLVSFYYWENVSAVCSASHGLIFYCLLPDFCVLPSACSKTFLNKMQ